MGRGVGMGEEEEGGTQVDNPSPRTCFQCPGSLASTSTCKVAGSNPPYALHSLNPKP